MSATNDVPFNSDDVHGARLLFVDMRLRSLIMGEARRGVVTRLFGVARDDQSVLASIILVGAVATVLRSLAPGPLPRLAGADAGIGGSVLDAALRGVAGAPAR